jgi:hypothetical protein
LSNHHFSGIQFYKKEGNPISKNFNSRLKACFIFSDKESSGLLYIFGNKALDMQTKTGALEKGKSIFITAKLPHYMFSQIP